MTQLAVYNPENDVIIARVRQAKALLVEVKTLSRAKQVVDMAHALSVYSQRQKLAAATRQDAHELEIDAETLLGEFLKTTPKATGTRGQLGGKDSSGAYKTEAPENDTATLKDLGINFRESIDAQFLADMKEIEPAIHQEIKEGKTTVEKARRTLKKEQAIETLKEMAAAEVEAPTGLYDVIVIDPPWPMMKIDRDVRPNQVAFDYPTMDENELSLLEIPADKDCHVWLWTTQKFLPMAFRLLDAWKLKYVCTFVWHKPGGFQPVGLPQYNAEFVLYARKGTPIFTETKDFPVCFDAPRGAHSEKPGEFYDMVRRVTAGRKLDMFNRRTIDGFDGWGNEAATHG